MPLFFYIFIFIISSVVLYFASEMIIKSLVNLSRFLGVTEFVLSFFVIAFASSITNLFVGITSAMSGMPELSFGDIMGNNMVALTLGIGLATLFAPKKEIAMENKTVEGTTFFTLIAGILPILFIFDGKIDRIEGLVLILFFFYYIYWIFSKKERFSKVFDEHEMNVPRESKRFFIDIFKIIVSLGFLLGASHFTVFSVSSIAHLFNIPLIIIGIVILGLGSALPEVYFAVNAARNNQSGLILGNLMGSVIIPASLILGIVAVINPIYSNNFQFLAISRVYLIIAIITFFVTAKTESKVTKKESLILITIYLLFLTNIILN